METVSQEALDELDEEMKLLKEELDAIKQQNHRLASGLFWFVAIAFVLTLFQKRQKLKDNRPTRNYRKT